MMKHIIYSIKTVILASLMAVFSVYADAPANQPAVSPQVTIETGIQGLLDEFVARRDELEQQPIKLYELVDARSADLFDFERISKAILAKNWKNATDEQRAAFGEEFKRLMIVTYAKALFQYSGEEKMAFGEAKVFENKAGVFAKLDSQVKLSDEGEPIKVQYLLVDSDGQWKIINLTVGTLNMITNYRNAMKQEIEREGIEKTISSLKEKNDEQYAAASVSS